MKKAMRKMIGLPMRLLKGNTKPSNKFNILDQYVRDAPSDQHALDIFKGEWACCMPSDRSDLHAGHVAVYACPRFKWGITELGGVEGKSVLELGPLEGAHSYLLERMGATSILAIEANQRAYLKCLIAKEILQLRKVRYLLGDFNRYLENTKELFDICIASGVLYHMADPVLTIKLISEHTDKVYLWTHYYDEACVRRIPHVSATFLGTETRTLDGFNYTTYKHFYGDDLQKKYFLGGPLAYSGWLPRKVMLDAFAHFGFKDIKTSFDEPAFAAGPAMCIVARK